MRYREKTESYRKKSRLYGINVFIAVSLFVCISLFNVPDVFAELGSYDINQYGPLTNGTSNSINDEYQGDNFWYHEYWEYGTPRDSLGEFCVGAAGRMDTHIGRDTHPIKSDSTRSWRVKSYGFGQVVYQGNNYNTVTIRNLLDCGEIVYFNLLHSSNISTLVSNNKFISKYQFIGNESNAGLGANGAIHLHTEVTNTDTKHGLDIITSDTAYPRTDAQPSRTSDIHLDSLLAHYDECKPDYHYYRPTDVVQYKELLPYLSTSSNPTTSSYSVFGYSNQKLYSSLTIIRKTSAKTFKQIGILAKGGSRSNLTGLSNNPKWMAQSWPTTASSYDDESANSNPITIPITAPNTNASAVQFANSSQTYSTGDYQFMAFISEFGLTYKLTNSSTTKLTELGIDSPTITKLKTLLDKRYYTQASFIEAVTNAGVDNTTLGKTIKIDNVDTSYKDLILQYSKLRDDLNGYPITFSVLNSSKDVIVDNDQRNSGILYEDNCKEKQDTNTIPGYYLSAKLPNGRSGIHADWKPNVSGKYNIYVYVPEGIEPQAVVYQIFPQGSETDNSKIVLSKALNTLSAENRWILLKSENNASEFTFNNKSYVRLFLTDQAPDDTKPYPNNRYGRTNYNISADTEVFLDAIKFVNIDETPANTNTNTYSSKTLNKIEQNLTAKGSLLKPYNNTIYQGFTSAKFSLKLPDSYKTRESTPRTTTETTTETTTILSEPSLPANRAETLLLAMLVNGNTFEQNLPSHYSDVPTTYELYDVIETATKLGIVQGYDGVNAGTFAPENTVTRAEALKIIFKTFNLDLLENSDEGPRGRVWSDSLFYDLDSTHWSYKYAKAAYLYEIMDGFGDGRFAPNAEITRSQLVKIVHQAMQLSNQNFITAGHFIEPEEEDYSENNNPPTGKVTVTKQSNGNYKLKAECSDPDYGQKLSYYWIAQNGSFANISPDETEVEWIPSAGGTSAPIELWVTDGYGLMTQIETETGDDPAPSSYPNPVPDTGITKCYNDTEEIPCPKEGEEFYGQDGNYSINPMSYTKLDSNGVALPVTATTWAMVKDNVTGLIWENNSHSSTWNDAPTVIASLNTAKFGGYSDWRLPTMTELGSIVDFSVPYPGPTINTSYFKDTVASVYWSSSTYAYYIYYAWGVDFNDGYDSYSDKDGSGYVRAVRSGQSIIGHFDPLVINGDRIVSDNTSGLMWQQDTAKTATGATTMVWKDALSYCENLTLGGYTDWRLPTVKELRSIVDYTVYSPAIDTNVFKDTVASFYWSSSTNAYSYSEWGVYFDYGYNGTYSSRHYVRAVRSGQSDIGSLDNLVISVSPASRTVDNNAGSTSFDVSNTGTGTMAWSASVTSGSDWLSIKSGSNGSNSVTITLNYTKNTATATRTGTITVTATGATNNPKTATVTQVGGVKETITITPSSPDITVSASSGFVQLYGASGASNITIEAGATAKLINFPGSNTITIKGDSTSFKISRSGAMVKFEGSDGTLVQMPATKTAQTIIFNDVSAKLVAPHLTVVERFVT